MKRTTIGLLLLVGLIVYTIVLAVWGDAIAIWSANQNLGIQLLTYYLTQSQFVLIFVGTIFVGNIILQKSLLKGTIAGLLVSTATDFSSSPRCVLQSGFVQNAPNIQLCSDSIVISFFDSFLPHIVSYYIFYLVLPIIFLIIAADLLGLSGFARELIGKVKK